MYHGGNLTEASSAFGEPPQGWLDLSTGINPVPYPATHVTPEAMARLPQPGALLRLEAAARQAYGIADGVALVAGGGTETLIDGLARHTDAKSVAIVSPTYGGHGEAWTKAGAKVLAVPTLEAAEASRAPVVVVVNPNNPDGRRWQRADLAKAAQRLALDGRQLVVDEAFADTAPEVSLCPVLDRAPALVFRSFGKFYGLAGLRLGFLCGTPALVRTLADQMPPWSVSGPAIEIGARALSDAAWTATARQRIARDSDRLAELLERAGLTVVANAGLFLLVRTAKAKSLHAGLAREGVWSRVFAEQPDWLRLGLPAASDWARFEQALATVVARLEDLR